MTNKPKEQNHEMYCDKDFCKYGDPSCPVIVRNANNKPPPRQFWYNREKMEERALEFWHSMFETRWYPEEEYDTLQAELDEVRKKLADSAVVAGIWADKAVKYRERFTRAERLLREVANPVWSIELYFEIHHKAKEYFEGVKNGPRY